MILRSIELENFGKFRGQTFELRRGMNLVIGPNEAGKTTLFRFIRDVLYHRERNTRELPASWSGALRLSSQQRSR